MQGRYLDTTDGYLDTTGRYLDTNGRYLITTGGYLDSTTGVIFKSPTKLRARVKENKVALIPF